MRPGWIHIWKIRCGGRAEGAKKTFLQGHFPKVNADDLSGIVAGGATL